MLLQSYHETSVHLRVTLWLLLVKPNPFSLGFDLVDRFDSPMSV